MCKKRRARNSHRPNSFKSKHAFRSAQLLVGGSIAFTLGGIGSRYGKRLGKKELERAKADKAKLESTVQLFSSQTKTLLESAMIKGGETREKLVKEFLKQNNIDECSDCADAIRENVECLSRDIVESAYHSRLSSITGLDEANQRIIRAEQDMKTFTYAGAAVGFVPGLIVALLLTYTMGRARRYFQGRARQKQEAEKALLMDSKRKKKPSSEASLVPSNGDNTAVIKPIDSTEFHLDRIEERKEREKLLRRAINGICGRSCSFEVANVIACELTDRITDTLIMDPNLLAKVLQENKAKLNPALEVYGWTVDEVQEEINKRGY
jgi:vacuolar-type H+-ATPase subunit I/STV1